MLLPLREAYQNLFPGVGQSSILCGEGEEGFPLDKGVAIGELWVEAGSGAEAQGVDGVGDRKGRVEGRLGDLMERETEGAGG